jgi:hypothetical protein
MSASGTQAASIPNIPTTTTITNIQIPLINFMLSAVPRASILTLSRFTTNEEPPCLLNLPRQMLRLES